jgi:hypothetical protein
VCTTPNIPVLCYMKNDFVLDQAPERQRCAHMSAWGDALGTPGPPPPHNFRSP